MSPEYSKVYIPSESAGRFEALLREIGGSFHSKFSTQTELRLTAAAIWISESESLRQQVSRFKQPQADQVIEAGINAGVVNLVSDAFKERQKGDIDLVTARGILADIFTADLPESLPEYIVLLTTSKGDLLSAGVHSSRLSPREIAVLINRYGLINGQEKKTSEIARDFGLNVMAMQRVEGRAIKKIGWRFRHKDD